MTICLNCAAPNFLTYLLNLCAVFEKPCATTQKT